MLLKSNDARPLHVQRSSASSFCFGHDLHATFIWLDFIWMAFFAGWSSASATAPFALERAAQGFNR